MLSIRDWYLLSRGGSRGKFLAQLDCLSPEVLTDLVRHELELEPVGSLRALEALRNNARTALPSMAELKQMRPVEQTLQYFFMHRGYFQTCSEMVLAREYPTCDRTERRRAVADLLVFDGLNNCPLIVELKRAEATDPLFGVVLEALDHWVFLSRNRRALEEILSQEGYRCRDTCPVRLAIAAPRDYFVQTERRSANDRTRNGEYARSIAGLKHLAKHAGVVVPLVSIEDAWMDTGGHFATGLWWHPTLGPRDSGAFGANPVSRQHFSAC
jgi:hypothetical protein